MGLVDTHDVALAHLWFKHRHLLCPEIMTSESGCLSTVTLSQISEYVDHEWALTNSTSTVKQCCNPQSFVRDVTFSPKADSTALNDFPLLLQCSNTQMKNQNDICSKHVVKVYEYTIDNISKCLTLLTMMPQTCLGTKPQTGCANFVFSLCRTMMADPGGRPPAGGVAQRRRGRRLRAMLRHEQQSIAMALAAALHHSDVLKEKKVELQQYAAQWGQNTGARARARPLLGTTSEGAPGQSR